MIRVQEKQAAIKRVAQTTIYFISCGVWEVQGQDARSVM